MGNSEKGRPSISVPSLIMLSAYSTGHHRRFIQYGELLSRSIFFHKNHARFLKFRACIYGGSFIRELPWSVRILYRNPVLNLGTWENRHEQTVNFSENQCQNPENSGWYIESVFNVTVTRSCISSPTQNFSAVILNEAVNILVLNNGGIFHKTAAQTAQ